jgi:hypothetical protein
MFNIDLSINLFFLYRIYLHNYITLFWAHKASLTTPLCIEVFVLGKWTFMY